MGRGGRWGRGEERQCMYVRRRRLVCQRAVTARTVSEQRDRSTTDAAIPRAVSGYEVNEPAEVSNVWERHQTKTNPRKIAKDDQKCVNHEPMMWA